MKRMIKLLIKFLKCTLITMTHLSDYKNLVIYCSLFLSWNKVSSVDSDNARMPYLYNDNNNNGNASKTARTQYNDIAQQHLLHFNFHLYKNHRTKNSPAVRRDWFVVDSDQFTTKNKQKFAQFEASLYQWRRCISTSYLA